MKSRPLLRLLPTFGSALLVAAMLPAGSAAAAATRYEAENATIVQGVVATNHTGYSGTGFVDSTNVAGSYVEFTVTAASAGTATIGVRYANGTTADRPADVTVNGNVVAAGASFPGTANWDTWATKTLTAPVVAGTNKIRLTGATATGGPNLDYVDVDVAASPGTDYQAENATIVGGVVEANHTGYTGTGFVNYDNAAGGYVEFTVNAATAGNHGLAIRYANGTTTDRPLDVSVNGQVVAPGISFPSTTNWDTWATRTVTAALTAGANTVRLTGSSAAGGPNLDKLGLTAPTDTESPTVPPNFRLVGTPAPNQLQVAWDPATDNVGVALYQVYNGGNIVAEIGGNVTTTLVRNLTPNTRYILTVAARDAADNVSQASNSLDITTPPSDDTQPPTVPANLRTTNVSATSVTLAWNAATDNTGVTGYNVYRDGAKFATVPDLQATADSLTANTTYSFTVEAFDANNNVSSRSAALSVRTPGAGGGGDPVYEKDVTKLDLPWGIGFLPDGSALVNERDRFEIVRVTADGQKTVVGKVTEAVTTGGEGGLLGLAVSPNYAADHYIYIYYTSSSDNRVARLKYENGALGAREPIVTGIAKNQFHNGGRLKFGPDGFLYIATGDAKTSSRAQDLNSLNGKILRVTTTGAAAPGNPFGTRIYSYGHRNVQGLAWDSQGRLWESELGESTWDELNLIQPGKNYGWPTCEGKCSDSRYVSPVQQWDVAAASPSGLEIVNDWIYMAAIRGSRLWVMHITGATTDAPRAFFNGRWGRLRTVVKTPDGGLWLTSTNNDKNGGTPTVLDNVIVKLKFAGAPFGLTSSAFAAGGTIPVKYTCQQDGVAGNDISPPLAWSPAAGAKSYAITLVDTANGNKHWVIWDVAPSAGSLPEGLGLGYDVPGNAPAKQKGMSTGNKALQFFGPCPGSSTHKYEFTLYALDVATLPGVTSSSTVAAVETAILAHDLASTKLAGNSAAHT
ncbi:YbhB/YbcL family Raf kinase inhibitor-like protein [Longispora sp. K20-0274]|uniref:YbhB/YbcL family Raf kinase inhibitor-like protein n=1 Tax=Longispora sp. K20-0274 TaxID=3088255 RepID=UPI003999A45A